MKHFAFSKHGPSASATPVCAGIWITNRFIPHRSKWDGHAGRCVHGHAGRCVHGHAGRCVRVLEERGRILVDGTLENGTQFT